MHIEWKKHTFSQNYDFYTNGEHSGRMLFKSFPNRALVNLVNNKYLFEISNSFSPKVQIIDLIDKKLLGGIKAYGFMRSKAIIYVANETFYWKQENILRTKWSVKDKTNQLVIFSDSYKKGTQTIHNQTQELLLLSGIFLTNRLRQMAY